MTAKDKYGRHELLDRTMLLLFSIGEWIIEHKGLKEDEKKIAMKASRELFLLYQLLGKRTLNDRKKKNAK